MFRIESFPDEILNIIIGSLEKLAPTRVLLRIVKPEQLRVKLPSNFYNMSWLPQEKILRKITAQILNIFLFLSKQI